jgi:hypothetical protein
LYLSFSTIFADEAVEAAIKDALDNGTLCIVAAGERQPGGGFLSAWGMSLEQGCGPARLRPHTGRRGSVARTGAACYKLNMYTLILRRASDQSASPDEAAEILASLKADVIHRSNRTMLVEVFDEARAAELHDKLPGWIVSPQGPPIQIPDGRLKIRSPR